MSFSRGLWNFMSLICTIQVWTLELQSSKTRRKNKIGPSSCLPHRNDFIEGNQVLKFTISSGPPKTHHSRLERQLLNKKIFIYQTYYFVLLNFNYNFFYYIFFLKKGLSLTPMTISYYKK